MGGQGVEVKSASSHGDVEENRVPTFRQDDKGNFTLKLPKSQFPNMG